MLLNFTNPETREKLLSIKSVDYETNVSAADAFILLISDLKYESDYEIIDNLCVEVAKEFGVSPKQVFDHIQSNQLSEENKKTILECAYRLIDAGKTMGNKMRSIFNASSWISHSLYECRVASVLAAQMGLDPEVALKLGLLHDIGRKFGHKFDHVLNGFEYLYSKGYEAEAVCSITHSFLPVLIEGKYKGNRCANCAAVEGFYIDENGNGVFAEDIKKEDVTMFLEQYEYNIYDIILNIADLMATADGITSPYSRVVEDIYTRKIPDPNNSPFFKICFVNIMRTVLFLITNNADYEKLYNIKDMKSSLEIDDLFVATSKIFMTEYNSFSQEERNKVM